MDAVEIYEKCVPSVVSIQADGEGEYSTGTGVVMSADGYILTNAHVVADSLRMSVLLSDGRVMEARLGGGGRRGGPGCAEGGGQWPDAGRIW